MRDFFSFNRLLRHPLNCGIWVVFAYAAIVGILSVIPHVAHDRKIVFAEQNQLAILSSKFAGPYDNDYEYVQPFLRFRVNRQSID